MSDLSHYLLSIKKRIVDNISFRDKIGFIIIFSIFLFSLYFSFLFSFFVILIFSICYWPVDSRFLAAIFFLFYFFALCLEFLSHMGLFLDGIIIAEKASEIAYIFLITALLRKMIEVYVSKREKNVL